MSIASLSARPSPPYDRVGVHIVTFEACSGFTHVIARWIARPPKAAFVTRLRSVRLLVQTARQLPDQSTTLWVESSSTGDSRPRDARPRADINRCTNRHRTAETFGQILSWLLETVRLRSAPELAVGARAETDCGPSPTALRNRLSALWPRPSPARCRVRRGSVCGASSGAAHGRGACTKVAKT